MSDFKLVDSSVTDGRTFGWTYSQTETIKSAECVINI